MPRTMTSLRPGAALVLALALPACMPPSWGAAALLHPARLPVNRQPTRMYDTLAIDGVGVHLKGWRFRGEGPVRRGTVVYLHGAGSNRGSGLSIVDHFVPAGFDVVAYDSRAHGDSEGTACTYGYYEKQDLLRVIARIEQRPIILFGISLGAAVALQAAAETSDVAAVISIATFSDLRTVGRERAPFFASQGNIDQAFRLAESEASFRVDEASPVALAPRIAAPVLILHGAADDETGPAHSQRVYDAVRAPKRLIFVPGKGHNNVLGPTVWPLLDQWLRATLRS
jgi:alpha-beta hydrolase superfamily lysophospholipase